MRHIGAKIADDVDAHGEEATAFVKRHLRASDIVATLRIADKMFGAIRLPANGEAQFLGDGEHQRIFAVDKAFCAKAAADIGGDDAQLFARNLQNVFGDNVAHAMHALAADIQRPTIAGGVIFGDRAARLQIIGDDARVDDFNFDAMARLSENGVGLGLVANMRVIGDIIGRPGKHQRRARRQGALSIDGGGQRSPSDLNRLRRVARLDFACGHRHGDDVADVMCFAGGDDRVRLEGRLRAVGIFHRGDAGQRPQSDKIGRGVNTLDARHRLGRLQVADDEARMRVRAAQKHRMERPGGRIIRCIAPLARNQPDILNAPNRLANAKLHSFHGFFQVKICWALRTGGGC